MKAIVLAGGLGTRLYPLSQVINKHLLPVGNVPMIFHPLKTIHNLGIQDVMVVVGAKSTGELVRQIGSNPFGFKNICFAYQENEDGIVGALRLARGFAQNDDIVVILGDQLFYQSQSDIDDAFKKFCDLRDNRFDVAMVVLAIVTNPQSYGIATLRNDIADIVEVIEKPENPSSNFAVTGIYFFNPSVWDVINKIKKSHRGQYEITDVLNRYTKQGVLCHGFLDIGQWIDPGESLHAYFEAQQLFSKIE